MGAVFLLRHLLGPCAVALGVATGAMLCPALAATLDYEEYLQRAHAAQSRGDWQSVASQFAQAINHPELPRFGTERLAALLGYGRAMGALCQFAEAEKYLLRAQDVARASALSPWPVLSELAALQEAQGKPAEAVRYRAQMAGAAEPAAPPAPAIAYSQRCPAK